MNDYRRRRMGANLVKLVKITLIISCAVAMWMAGCGRSHALKETAVSVASSPAASVAASPGGAMNALSWLPADTETVVVANGPFLLAQNAGAEDDSPSHPISNEETLKSFQEIPTALMIFHKGLIQQLSGHQALFAIEGSRHFRVPTALGPVLYEGCEIVEFDGDIHDAAERFMKATQKPAATFERIEGQNVRVFREKLEEDIWTTLVAFPKPNLIVAATSREYLREVLSRIAGRDGPSALPQNLPEWKYIDVKSPSWGLRHYDRGQAALDPTSPLAGEKSTQGRDDGAIGIAFNLGGDQTATVTYLSNSKDAARKMKTNLFPPTGDLVGAGEWQIKYREAAPGAMQASFTLKKSDGVWYFTFTLMCALGHCTYV